MMVRQNLVYADLVRLPYSQWLMKEDRYEEALRILKQMGRSDLSMDMYLTLADNSLEQGNFADASLYCHEVSLLYLKLVDNLKTPDPREARNLEQYRLARARSQIYAAYSKIVNFVESPFCSNSENTLF